MSIRRGAVEIKLITTSEDIYVGESLNGKKHGIGTMYYDSGAIHICNWQNDIAHGHGIYKFADGTEYVGDWRNNMFHGRCNEIYYKNGDYYKGEVRKGTLTGKGKMLYSDRKQYSGMWKNGIWHGYGKMIYQNKDIYCGNFVNGLRNLYGVYTWSNGNTYEGMWKNDELHDGIVNNKKEGVTERCVWTTPSPAEHQAEHLYYK